MLNGLARTIAIVVAAGTQLSILASCAVHAGDVAAIVAPDLGVEEASSTTAIVAVRRITESQYRAAIADVFGSDIAVNAKFEPETRADSLLAIGGDTASISANGFTSYFAAARSIANQAVSKRGLGLSANCTPSPAVAKMSADGCVRQVLQQTGSKLFRRPMTALAVDQRVRIASEIGAQTGSVSSGLEAGLVSILTAPEFLFRIEKAERVDGSNVWTLDPYSRASRISFLLWDAPPDQALMNAAATRTLMTEDGLQAQVDRLMASPRIEQGVRAFFSDYLQLDLFDGLIKDPAQYPKFSVSVATAAKEQTLKVVVNEVMRGGDFRDLFTTRNSFINRSLAAIYQVPYASPNGDEWVPYTFDAADGQSGLLTQVTFNALFSHPARSSPTKRGVAINDIFLCQTVPQPPADVDLSGLTNAANPGKTVRDRLVFHRSEPMCTGCHTLTDPAGLALEQFDGIGQRRFTENGVRIDVSAEFFGIKLSGATGLGETLRNDARVPACLMNRLFTYDTGRAISPQERKLTPAMTKQFTDDGFDFVRAMARVAAQPSTYIVPASLAPESSGNAT
jgi:hypothetical protein